jgi:hypothetical protein
LIIDAGQRRKIAGPAPAEAKFNELLARRTNELRVKNV